MLLVIHSQGQNTIFGEGASAFLLGKISAIFIDFEKWAPFLIARKNKRINLLNKVDLIIYEQVCRIKKLFIMKKISEKIID